MVNLSIRRLARVVAVGLDAAFARALALVRAEDPLFAGILPARFFQSAGTVTQALMGRVHNRADAAPMEYG